MEYPSATSAGTTNLPGVVRAKRRYYRQKVHTLAYVNLDQTNGGVIREVSEAGVAVQAVAPLSVNQQVQLRFELLSPRTRVETTGRVVWADSMGQAGLEFLELPTRTRRLLKDWLFTQLLARACGLYATDSVFIHRKQGEEATELLFSGPPRPALTLEAEPIGAPRVQDQRREDLRLFWCPIPISARSLSGLLDALIVLSAVLLFSVVSLAMIQVFPTWPIGLGLGLSAAAIFAVVYRWLFAAWIGATPGVYLAQLAGRGVRAGRETEKEERPRFR
jgi:hypothetical protein